MTPAQIVESLARSRDMLTGVLRELRDMPFQDRARYKDLYKDIYESRHNICECIECLSPPMYPKRGII